MDYIHLGCGYRLHRRDSMNWELQEWRKPADCNLTKSTEPKWRNCGRYYQSLSAALRAVYEMALRDDDGEIADLEHALDKAEEIKRELMGATADLRKVE